MRQENSRHMSDTKESDNMRQSGSRGSDTKESEKLIHENMRQREDQARLKGLGESDAVIQREGSSDMRQTENVIDLENGLNGSGYNGLISDCIRHSVNSTSNIPEELSDLRPNGSNNGDTRINCEEMVCHNEFNGGSRQYNGERDVFFGAVSNNTNEQIRHNGMSDNGILSLNSNIEDEKQRINGLSSTDSDIIQQSDNIYIAQKEQNSNQEMVNTVESQIMINDMGNSLSSSRQMNESQQDDSILTSANSTENYDSSTTNLGQNIAKSNSKAENQPHQQVTNEKQPNPIPFDPYGTFDTFNNDYSDNILFGDETTPYDFKADFFSDSYDTSNFLNSKSDASEMKTGWNSKTGFLNKTSFMNIGDAFYGEDPFDHRKKKYLNKQQTKNKLRLMSQSSLYNNPSYASSIMNNRFLKKSSLTSKNRLNSLIGRSSSLDQNSFQMKEETRLNTHANERIPKDNDGNLINGKGIIRDTEDLTISLSQSNRNISSQIYPKNTSTIHPKELFSKNNQNNPFSSSSQGESFDLSNLFEQSSFLNSSKLENPTMNPSVDTNNLSLMTRRKFSSYNPWLNKKKRKNNPLLWQYIKQNNDFNNSFIMHPSKYSSVDFVLAKNQKTGSNMKNSMVNKYSSTVDNGLIDRKMMLEEYNTVKNYNSDMNKQQRSDRDSNLKRAQFDELNGRKQEISERNVKLADIETANLIDPRKDFNSEGYKPSELKNQFNIRNYTKQQISQSFTPRENFNPIHKKPTQFNDNIDEILHNTFIQNKHRQQNLNQPKINSTEAISSNAHLDSSQNQYKNMNILSQSRFPTETAYNPYIHPIQNQPLANMPFNTPNAFESSYTTNPDIHHNSFVPSNKLYLGSIKKNGNVKKCNNNSILPLYIANHTEKVLKNTLNRDRRESSYHLDRKNNIIDQVTITDLISDTHEHNSKDGSSKNNFSKGSFTNSTSMPSPSNQNFNNSSLDHNEFLKISHNFLISTNLDYNNVTVFQLKKLIKEFGLNHNGKKEELILRIKETRDVLQKIFEQDSVGQGYLRELIDVKREINIGNGFFNEQMDRKEDNDGEIIESYGDKMNDNGEIMKNGSTNWDYNTEKHYSDRSGQSLGYGQELQGMFPDNMAFYNVHSAQGDVRGRDSFFHSRVYNENNKGYTDGQNQSNNMVEDFSRRQNIENGMFDKQDFEDNDNVGENDLNESVYF